MGAWSTNSFGNDSACDWTCGLSERDVLAYVSETLDRVLSAGAESLDDDIATEGVAACEVVARLMGNWGVRDSYSQDVDEWVESQAGLRVDDDLKRRAIAVVDRVQTDPSDLLEIWEECEEWLESMADLRSRLVSK